MSFIYVKSISPNLYNNHSKKYSHENCINCPGSNAAIDFYCLNDHKNYSNEETQKDGIVAEDRTDEKREEEKQVPQKAKSDPPQIKPDQSNATRDWDKKIIRNAVLNVEVKDYKIYYSRLKDYTQKAGGYISQEQQRQSDYKIESVVTLRVPVEQFDNTISSIVSEVEKVNERNITSEDVTTEVVDTKSRMEAKRQVRDRYLDLLKQARTMDDILKVQSEVNDIQEDIEAGTGRISYLSHASAYSTIVITFYQVLDASATVEDAEPNFLKKTSEAFGEGWSWIGQLFIGLVSVWPLLLIIVSGLFLFKRLRKSRSVKATE